MSATEGCDLDDATLVGVLRDENDPRRLEPLRAHRAVANMTVNTSEKHGRQFCAASAAPNVVFRFVRIHCWFVAATVTAPTACAPATHVLVGKQRPPITPDQVTIYSHPPSTSFEEIAVLDASNESAFGTGGQRSVDKVVARLKIEAAKLGANGVILEGFSDSESGSIGTGAGSDTYGNHSSVGVGVGGSLAIFKKTGHGDAIYVPTSAN